MKYIGVIFLFIIQLSLTAQELPDSIDLRIEPTPLPEAEKNNVKNKLRNLGISRSFKRTKTNVALTVVLQQAKSAESQQKYLTAIHHYQKAVDLYASQGEMQEVTDYLQYIAFLYQKAGRTQQALDQYELVLERKEASGDTTNLKEIRDHLTRLVPAPPETIVTDAVINESSEDVDEVIKESERLRSLAETTEKGQDYKKSLEYYKLYTELSNKQTEAEQTQQLALQEKTFQLEKQAQQVQLLETEREVQALTLAQQQEQLLEEQNFKRNLLVGIIVLALAMIATYVMYRGKRKALNGLNQAYKDLSETKNRLVSAEEELKSLLDQQLSKGVALQLMDHDKADKAQKKFVCIMFLDIRGFTPFAEKLQPEELIKYQNDVFGLMIDIVDTHHGVINQFLGDGFMATFGLQDDQSKVCDEALAAAIEIITIVNEKSASGEIPVTRVGIGLHAGNVVAGNVGTAVRKQYSVTGNTVITASRIEQLNKEFKSQLLISKEVYAELTEPDNLPKDFIDVKVKGRKQPIELLRIA